jgi:hypothetical protein
MMGGEMMEEFGNFPFVWGGHAGIHRLACRMREIRHSSH